MKNALSILSTLVLLPALLGVASLSAHATSMEDNGLEKDATGRLTRRASEAPSPVQVRQMRDAKYGMFIHFGINTFVDREWTDGTVPAEKYAPQAIDADEWVMAAKNAGMSHVVLVCKHHDGFCNWPTKLDELNYSVAHTVNKTDVVKAVADACKRHGVRFGVYYSLWDRRWDAKHAADYKKDRAATHRAYTDYMVGQIQELLGDYGPVSELWLDGPWGKTSDEWDIARVYDAVKRLQPACQMAINATIGDKGAVLPENQKEGQAIRYFPSDFRLLDPHLPAFPDPKVFTHEGKKFYLPFESTVCMNNQWFWHAKDHGLKSLDALERLYYHATAQNNMLLLNSPPGPDGHMRPETLKRLAELRARLGLPIGGPFPRNVSVGAKAQASSTWNAPGLEAQNAVGENPDSRWSAAAGDVAPTLSQAFAAPTRVNRVLLREYGEHNVYRVHSFIIEAQVDGQWREVAKGAGIGVSKMLDFPPVQASALRIRILDAKAPPSLWSFWAFDTAR